MDSLPGERPLVLLGTPNSDSTKLYALTVTEGDPTWAGVLANTHLGLPVYHITEPVIKSQIEPGLYDNQVGLAEVALETEDIAQALRDVREANGQPA